tara:strand:+ start:112 stop:666 length:555 start_codon:yes stop_codon:yes gene_type:complete
MSTVNNNKIVDLRGEFLDQIESMIPSESDFYRNSELWICPESGYLVNGIYQGSQLLVYPSGKIYTAWTTNQTWRDVVKDLYFEEMLEERLHDKMFSWLVESGDCYIIRYESDDYYTTQDNKTFYQYGGQLVADNERELVQHMYDSGYFPSVVFVNERGSVNYYDWQVSQQTHLSHILFPTKGDA